MIKKSVEISGQTLTIETGRLAKQASGSVLVSLGETVVLVACTANQGIEPDRGFFPLTIDYREKFYASGMIPGGFFKREARPSEKEIIGCRLTDRPLRPLFPKGFYNETQISNSVLSFDGENNGDILGTIGASAALSISDIPWEGPVFHRVVQYMYTGVAKVEPDVACDMLMASNEWDMTGLQNIVEDDLGRMIDDDSVAMILAATASVKAPRLRARCIHYALTHLSHEALETLAGDSHLDGSVRDDLLSKRKSWGFLQIKKGLSSPKNGDGDRGKHAAQVIVDSTKK